MRGKWLFVALIGLLQACGGGEEEPGILEEAELDLFGDQPLPEMGIDHPEFWKLDLTQVDRAFNEAVNRGGPSQWSTFFTPDGLAFEAGVGLLQGQDSIQLVFDERIQSGELAGLRWNPSKAEVSLSGDLGYTWGSFAEESVDSTGVRTKVLGLYVNIWRKQEDGTWKVEMHLRVPATEPEVVIMGAPGGG